MGVRVTVRGDFQGAGVDVNMLEQYVRALVEEATREPTARVVHHGVVKQDLQTLKEQLLNQSWR